jgi:hypothetical protein
MRLGADSADPEYQAETQKLQPNSRLDGTLAQVM